MRNPKFFVIIIFCFLFMLWNLQSLHAVTLGGVAPRYTGAGAPAGINTIINDLYMDARTEASGDIEQIEDQVQAASAFSEANTYASEASSMWAFRGYELIGVMTEFKVGVQLPVIDFSMFEGKFKEIDSKGDAQVGLSPTISISIGNCLGWINKYTKKAKWLRDISLELNFLTFSDTYEFSGYRAEYETLNGGFGVYYQLFRPKKLAKKLLLWRGVSIGGGFRYLNTTLRYKIDKGDYPYTYTDPSETYSVTVFSDLEMAMKMETYTIPIEIVTSMRLVYVLNIALGVGIDFNWGYSELSAKSIGTVLTETTADTSGWGDLQEGTIWGKSVTEENPFPINGKIMIGVGITAAPVVVCNVSFIYYIEHGASVGVSAGFFW